VCGSWTGSSGGLLWWQHGLFGLVPDDLRHPRNEALKRCAPQRLQEVIRQWLAKFRQLAMVDSFMRLFRAILSLCLALLWWPVTNGCLVAASFPAQIEAACDCGAEHEEEKRMPCSANDCASCATLENGVNLAALQQPAVPQPVLTLTDSLTELLERLAQLEAGTLLEPPPVPPPSPPPVWWHDVTTAQPVRGPSFAV
jgi:hypothetical protein